MLMAIRCCTRGNRLIIGLMEVVYYYFSPLLNNGATARSLPPSTLPYRYIPRLSRIVAGTLTQENPKRNDAWETVLERGRTLHWSFVVIDRPNGNQMGNTAYKTIEVVVK